jgi:hypothetical protein
MSKDPDKNSEYERQATGEEGDEVEGDSPALQARPTCPRCGWHNTRPSHSKNLLDTMLRTFSFRPYRCRSCGNRFRVIRRAREN